jgi:hypothetical protein
MSTAYTRRALLRAPTFGNHIVELAPVACSRSSGGDPVGPLATTWVDPKRVAISISSNGTGQSVRAASYADTYSASPCGLLNEARGLDVMRPSYSRPLSIEKGNRPGMRGRPLFLHAHGVGARACLSPSVDAHEP